MIKYLEKNKLYVIVKLIISIFFATTITIDRIFVYSKNIFAGIDKNYLTNIELKDICIGIVVFFCSYIAISLIEIIVNKIEDIVYVKEERREKNIKVFFVFFIIILICWLPYILSFFPGGVYSDTATTLNQLQGKEKFNCHQPIGYAFILKIFVNIGTYQLGLKLLTVVQVLAMAGICSYFVYWMYKKGIISSYLIITIAFFGIYPLIPLYAVSIWKDTPYCIILFAFIIYIAEIVYRDGKNLENTNGIILYELLSFLIAFLRNNGIYILIGTLIFICIAYKKDILKTLKKFLIISIAEILIIMLIQGPVFNKLELNEDKFTESVGSLLQQMAYVVVNNGNLNEEQIEFINKVCPIEKIKKIYSPCLVDSIKWNEDYDVKFVENNKKEFIKIWFEVFMQNPKMYAKAYILNTIGYWDINRSSDVAYTNPTMWYGLPFKQYDYLQKLTNISIKNVLCNIKTVSSAIFLFIMLIGVLMTIYRKKYKNLLIYLPGIFTWLTIMLASPIAFSLRYVYILVMMVPLSIITPFLKNYNEKKASSEKLNAIL